MRLLYSRHLEHFLAIYAAGSLRGAAQQGAASQAALSKSLKVLENALSLSLFERRADGVVPTAAAQVLQRHAQHIINSARYCGMEIGMLRGGQAGTLRVGSGMVWSATRMPGLLAKLHALYPQLEISLHTGVAEQLTPRLLAGHLDVVFASLPPDPLPQGFASLHLLDAEMALFARKAHPLFRRAPLKLKDLDACDFVGFADDQEFSRQAEALFGRKRLRPPRIILRSSSLETLLATVSASDSLAILPSLLAARASAEGLAPLELSQALWRIRVGISYRVESAELAPMKTLLEMARQAG